jgi:hypothetical protein
MIKLMIFDIEFYVIVLGNEVYDINNILGIWQ